jgi:polar amino acid transport system permease protein
MKSERGAAPAPFSFFLFPSSFLLALLLLSALCFGAFWLLDYHWSWDSVWKYRRLFWQGWLATLGIAGLALPLSCAVGLGLAMGRRAPWAPVREAARIWVEITRGTPLLVQIWFYWYVFGQELSREHRFAAGALILSLFSGAYISEIIRAGIEAIGKSQWETARALGLTLRQTYRHVVFPQALRQSLPPLAGQCASIVKDSSLLSVLGIAELTQAAGEVNSFTFSAFESYIPVAIGYLVLTLPISLWTQRLERRVRFDT